MGHPTLILIIFGLLVTLTISAQARPEYALQRTTNCITCHALPMGAGPRNVFGKIFGSRSYKTAETSNSDLYYGDFRAEYFSPIEKPREAGKANGLALMVAAASVNVPIRIRDDGSSLRAVLTYDMGILSQGTREAVFLWTLPTEKNVFLPDQVLFGRFYAPFGLLSDEHRTYTKMQTRTAFRDFNMGGLMAWDFSDNMHLDLAVTDGNPQAGSLSTGDVESAVFANLRWIPSALPFLFGVSYTHHESQVNDPASTLITPVGQAGAGYLGIDFNRITSGRWNAVVTGETVIAKGFNGNTEMASFFFPSDGTASAYQNAVSSSQSRGYYSQFKWDITRNITFMYKFDYLQPDVRFPGDYFLRNGIGFRYQFESNEIVYLRYEKSTVTRPEIQNSSAFTAYDDIWLMLRIWI